MGYLIAMAIMFGFTALLFLMSIGTYAQMKENNPKWNPDPPAKNTTVRRVFRLLGSAAGIWMMWQVVLISPGVFIYGVFAVYCASVIVTLVRSLTKDYEPEYSQNGAVGSLLYALVMTLCLIGFGLAV